MRPLRMRWDLAESEMLATAHFSGHSQALDVKTSAGRIMGCGPRVKRQGCEYWLLLRAFAGGGTLTFLAGYMELLLYHSHKLKSLAWLF